MLISVLVRARGEAVRTSMTTGSGPQRLWGRTTGALRRVNRNPGLITAARGLRRMLPGTAEPAFPTNGADRVARLILQASGDAPSAAHEFGMAAVQAWQALTRPADGSVTIMFTDLVGFSTWALHAGDDQVLRLLREFFEVTEDVVRAYGGRVVKSLGDGVMAVFTDADRALEAASAVGGAVQAVNVDGYRPLLRVGLHHGHPRRVGRDYLGVDVNIAARIADAAGGGEVLASEQVLAAAHRERYVTRPRRFRAKGTPKDLEVHAVKPRH